MYAACTFVKIKRLKYNVSMESGLDYLLNLCPWNLDRITLEPCPWNLDRITLELCPWISHKITFVNLSMELGQNYY